MIHVKDVNQQALIGLIQIVTLKIVISIAFHTFLTLSTRLCS